MTRLIKLQSLIMLLFCSILLILGINENVFASFTSGDYVYEILSDGTAEIKEYTGTTVDLTIPAELDEYKVSRIGDWAFFQNKTLKTVVIPDGIKSIGQFAFNCCSNLKKVTIPDSVISLEGSVFGYCKNLTDINIPNGITELDGTFSECYSLENIIIPHGVVTIGEYTFSGCGNLKSISLPATITTIGTMAFGRCNSLESVQIPETVTSIGEKAFIHCEGIKEIFIPKNVETIGMQPFLWMTSLESIEVSVENKKFKSDNGILFNKDGSELIVYPCQIKDTQYKVPDTVERILSSAFAGCDYIENVIIPEGVKYIEGAFSFCKNLKSVYLPHSLIKISASFIDCNNLNDIYFEGNKFEWDLIEKSNGINNLTNCTIHFSEEIITKTEEPVITVKPDSTEDNGKSDIDLGDIDENNVIDAKDALLVLQYAAKLVSLSETQIISADVDKSENIDAGDALLILQYSAKIIADFDISDAEYLQKLKNYIKKNGQLSYEGYRYLSYDYGAKGESYYNTEIDRIEYRSKDDKVVYSYYLPGSSYDDYVEYIVTINKKQKVSVECKFKRKEDYGDIIEYEGDVSFYMNEYSLGNSYYDDSENWSEEIMKIFNSHVHTAMLYMGDYLEKTVDISLDDLFIGYEYYEKLLHKQLGHLFGYSELLNSNIESLKEYVYNNGYGDGNIKYFGNGSIDTSLNYNYEVYETKICYDTKEGEMYFQLRLIDESQKYYVNVKMYVLPDRTSYFLITMAERSDEGGFDFKQQFETTLMSRKIHYTLQYNYSNVYPQDYEISEEYQKLANYCINKIVEESAYLLGMGTYFFDIDLEMKDLGYDFYLLKTER